MIATKYNLNSRATVEQEGINKIETLACNAFENCYGVCYVILDINKHVSMKALICEHSTVINSNAKYIWMIHKLVNLRLLH